MSIKRPFDSKTPTDAALDRTLIRVDAETFDRFLALLDAPPQPSDRLRRLMQQRPPWGECP